MTTAELFTRDLTSLIRTYDEDAVKDAAALANRVLDPFRSELDRATQRFSKELFITTALHIVFSDQKPIPTLQLVLDCIVDPQWETESKMLEGICSFRNYRIRRQSVLAWLKDFDGKSSLLSVGCAQRIVSCCHSQWCKAFDLPHHSKNMDASHSSKDKAESTDLNGQPLNNIRIGTGHELFDATALATKIMGRAKGETDEAIYTYTHDLFIAVALLTAHTVRFANLGDILEFLADPTWNSDRQIYLHVGQCSELAKSKQIKTKTWVADWMKRMLAMPYNVSQSFCNRSHKLLQNAYHAKSSIANGRTEQAGQPAVPTNAIQVFNMADVEKALTMMCDLKDEKKGAGERLLKSAQMNNGYRLVPDVKMAGKILEKAKSQFENLIEPISHLQNNLALAAVMKPGNFRVTPILLLGDPGIGKTFLAMALANGLDGSTEKMSAGGAQGGFQLTGSHSSWSSARYGQVFKALADGKTTSPVFVIDEIDKIGADVRYPVLPVLLDLFEPNTASQFKDEFFEMDFDASRIIYILTANTIDTVPEPLLSRVEVFDVPRPEPEQRLRIIQGEVKQLREATGKKIKLDRSTGQQLADRMDIDLRKTTRIVRDAFANAMLTEEKVAKLIIPEVDGSRGSKPAYSRSEIGFR